MTNPFEDNPNDLVIQMVATGKFLIFRDGIDDFSRSYNISWESVDVYGRQDAIQTYQATGETINLSWPLKPGTDPCQYEEQLQAILALGKFARPQYSNGSIIESPLLRIKYRNLIVQDYPNTPVLIAPNSITVTYGDRARDIQADASTKLVVPKRINITLGGAVINTTRKYYSKESGGSSGAGNSNRPSNGSPGPESQSGAENNNTRRAAVDNATGPSANNN
tara:strand:- start:712 stop:1377 length:666 start_codon:yes stop_codon:yes gene_type:complete